jgi:hypothetical protein
VQIKATLDDLRRLKATFGPGVGLRVDLDNKLIFKLRICAKIYVRELVP